MNHGGLLSCFFYADAEMETEITAPADAVIQHGSLSFFSSYADATAQVLICAKQNNFEFLRKYSLPKAV